MHSYGKLVYLVPSMNTQSASGKAEHRGAAEGTEANRTWGFCKSSKCSMPEQEFMLLLFDGCFRG